MVDIKNKRCELCTSKPSYDFKDGKGARCAKHKIEGMINIFNKRCEDCDSIASFGYPGGKRTCCSFHVKTGMVDLTHKACKTVGCTIIVASKYNGYCYRCFIHTFPDNKIVRNHKIKERAVADYVSETYSNLSLVFDKPVEGGCSNKRPDIFIDMCAYVIVIEIDENQHSAYDCSCENKRLMQLFLDAGSRPLHMIRFNPDQYYDDRQKSIPSCWGMTKERGLLVVKDAKKIEWIQRLDALKSAIDLVMSMCEHKEISVKHLFYDGFKM